MRNDWNVACKLWQGSHTLNGTHTVLLFPHCPQRRGHFGIRPAHRFQQFGIVGECLLQVKDRGRVCEFQIWPVGRHESFEDVRSAKSEIRTPDP